MPHDPSRLRADTLIQHYAEEEKILGAVTQPIFQNSTFLFDTMDDILGAFTEGAKSGKHVYSRNGNPTVELAEKKIAVLEGTDSCRLFGCGMGAISAAIISCVESGSHIVMVDSAYGPTRRFASEYLNRFGVTCTFVEGSDTGEVIAALRPETTLVYLETPSSILFRIQDLRAIAAECRARGITTATDNTYCTPLLMRPHELGIDIVVHSGSKYFGGHSDINAGALCTDAARMQKISGNEVDLFGAILHPFSAWLLLRGLRTLPLRIKRHGDTAQEIAEWLDARDEIETVLHVGLPSHPGHDLARSMMSGFGGLFSFVPVTTDPSRIKAFVDRLELFGRGVSWGGFESLALALPSHPADWPEKRWIVRMFCGLEDPKDLIADIERALVELQG